MVHPNQGYPAGRTEPAHVPGLRIPRYAQGRLPTSTDAWTERVVTHLPPDHSSPSTPHGPGVPPPPPAAPGAYPPYPPAQPYGAPIGDGGFPGPAVPPPAPAARGGLRGWHLGVAAGAALVVGLGAGVLVGDGADSARVAELETQVNRLEDQLTARDDEIATLDSELNLAQQNLVAAEAAVEEAPETESTANESDTADAEDADADTDAADDETATGAEYTAGSYVFSDVQVSEDFVGDFDVRVRMTNTGSAKDYVGITATLFADGSVVGTATGLASGVAADSTITMEMISLDDYVAWDAIEFQVDAEF